MIRIFRHYISRAYLWLLSIEFCVFFVSMYFGSNVRFLMTDPWYTEQDITFASIIFASAMSLSCLGLGLYRRTLSGEDYNLVARACVSFGIAIFAIVTIYYLLPELYVARSVLIYAVAFAFLGIILTRYLFYKIVNLERLKRRFLVIGSGKKANQLITLNDSFIHRGFTIVGFLAMPDEIPVVSQSQLITLRQTNNCHCREI